jgi:hypothetical protein
VRRVACHAGSSPTNNALPAASATAAASTGPLSVADPRRGTPSGASLISSGNDHHAMTIPAMPPNVASTRLSESTWRTMRPVRRRSRRGSPARVIARRGAPAAGWRRWRTRINSTSATEREQDQQSQPIVTDENGAQLFDAGTAFPIEVRMIRGERLRDAREFVVDLRQRDLRRWRA